MGAKFKRGDKVRAIGGAWVGCYGTITSQEKESGCWYRQPRGAKGHKNLWSFAKNLELGWPKRKKRSGRAK